MKSFTKKTQTLPICTLIVGLNLLKPKQNKGEKTGMIITNYNGTKRNEGKHLFMYNIGFSSQAK